MILRSASPVRIAIVVLIVCSLATPFALGQNFGSDARRIALGGAGNDESTASKLIEEQQPYRSIPLPIGLFQVFKNRRFFDPDDPNFDPVRAIEYAADPVHLTLGRNSNSAGNVLVKNLIDAEFSRDLNTYRGFTPSREIKAAGLVSPTWGKTFHVAGNAADPTFHGIYVGVGPYLHVGTELNFDPQLIDVLSSPTPVYKPNTNFLIGDTATGQGAVSITGGYRGRLRLPGGVSGGAREGLYVAANYNYLRGVHYDTADLRLRIDTDSAGLVTVVPSTTPIAVTRRTSKSGNGFAIDAAMAVVTRHWDAGFGVDGVGNRITWKELSSRQYVLQSLFNGGDFVRTSVPSPFSEQRVTLPVRYSGNGTYHTDRWSATTEVGRGMQGFSMRNGGEYLIGRLALRGGARYSREIWHGATGIGFNFTKGFGVDVAAFQTSTNIEESRRTSFAVSLRLNRNTP